MAKDKTPIHLSPEFVGDVRTIIENGRKQAYEATSAISLATYWNIGRRIVEEEQHGNARAEYGTRVIAGLAEQLRKDYGSGYGKRNLAYYRQFYLTFNNIEILHEFVQNLSWVLNDSNNLFAAKYMAYMPTEEELRQEIERQKRFFLEHHRP